MRQKRVVASISGGKDSMFALYKAMQEDYKPVYLFNTVSKDYERVRFHGLKSQVIQRQAKALNLPLLQITTNPESYEEEYTKALQELVKKEKIEGLVLGDIFLQDCFDWAKNICDKLGIELIEPLWQIPSKELFTQFVASGFQGIVVSTQATLLDQSWVGRKLDDTFLLDIEKLPHIDICGENGEYHTLITDGPIFQNKLEINIKDRVNIGGYWFLDIE